jgi:hypothetical protein
MKGIRFTKPEIALIEFLGDAMQMGDKDRRIFDSILSKCHQVPSTKSSNPNIKPLEDVLIAQAPSKLIRLTEPSGYARASRQAGLLGITSDSTEQMAKIGAWINVQHWLPAGSLTILDVLSKWSNWYPKANNANIRQSTNKPGSTTQIGRPKAGFR